MPPARTHPNVETATIEELLAEACTYGDVMIFDTASAPEVRVHITFHTAGGSKLDCIGRDPSLRHALGKAITEAQGLTAGMILVNG